MNTDHELTSIQKGRIAESLVASSLILASGGRLSPFTPLSDDCGIDLIVLDKETRRSLCIQVKSRIEKPPRPTVQFGVRKSSFRDDPNRFLLGVLFDPVNPALTTSWFIPMARVAVLGVEKSGTYAVMPAIASDSNDRYRTFRHDSARDLVVAIFEALNGAARPDEAGVSLSLGGC
ncbi:hypothetical protein [Hyphomicrobium sp. ghe19]|uniref:hypothetical protein n=1 Tax=Hyphomicrobium sp. ghe19 TaxID=2682968 RepID=UPI0030CCD3EF